MFVTSFCVVVGGALLRQHEKDLRVRFILSDEIEAWFLLFETTVHDWGVLAFASTLTDKSCQPVCVADAGWLLYRARHVVVGVAELVGKQLNLVWSFSDAVKEHGEASRGSHSLPSCN